MKKVILLIFVLVFVSCKQTKKEKQQIVDQKVVYKTLGTIERLSPKLDELIAPNTKIEIIADGFDWSEGPLWLEEQQQLIWSDVPQNTVYCWKKGEDSQVYLKPSGYTGEISGSSNEPGSNGLLLDKDGNLVLCQHGDRRVARMDSSLDNPKSEFITMADKYKGKKLNSPNDATYDNNGNLYFTDPPYGLQGLDASEDKEITFNGVYKLDTQGNLMVMVDSLTKPNGIAFNEDFTKCYVANSDPKKAYWAVYDINEEGNFNQGKQFFNVTDMVASKKGLPDGLKVDNKGNLFATGPGGVLVFSSEGEHLGTINTEQHTSNCAFNKDKTELFITADAYILRVMLKG